MESQPFGSQFRCPERLALLTRLKDLIGEVKPLIWASLWMSDLERLRSLVVQAEENPDTILYSFDGIALGSDYITKCGC